MLDLQYLLPLKPNDAIAYFEKKAPLESWRYEEIWQESQAKAFTVAKSANMDILTDIQQELNSALNEGKTFQEFKNELVPTLTKKGWLPKIDDTVDPDDEKAVKDATAHRLNTIYYTNMNVAYSAGNYKAMVEASSVLPYWKYVAINDGRTRPSHLKLDGLIFHHTHPFWQNFYPANGWGCRCDVVAVSEKEALASGKLIGMDQGEIVWDDVVVSQETGEVKDRATFTLKNAEYDLSMATDAGWSYNPGAAGIIENDTYTQALTMPVETRYAYITEMSKQPSLYPELYEGFTERALASTTSNYEIVAGYIPSAIIDTLAINPKSASIVMTDREINLAQDIVDKEDLENIPDYVLNNDGIYSDPTKDDSLFFIKEIDDNRSMKIPVTLDYEKVDEMRTVNYLTSPSYINPSDLYNYTKL